jgi:sugar (pentulose or hexulose) kinase
MRNQYPRLLEKTKVLLHMADMVHFDLCGEAMTDWTLATAGQMFNLQNQSWDLPLLAQLDIPAHILPPVAMSPRVIGRVKPETSPHPALNNIPVVSTAHHDTACATVVLRPMQEGLFFISLGSYAMAGAVLNSACWSNAAKPEKQALIGIADRQWGLFAACAGLWIIQECRRIWHEQGVQIEYDRLAELAGKSNYRGGIDLKTARFAKPSNMVNEIKNVCRETGAGQPNEPGDIARLVFDSLAVGFECAVRDLEKAVQMPCRKLFLIGGGSRNRYLVRQITDRVGCDVVVGPAEATVVGNLTLQHEIIE